MIISDQNIQLSSRHYAMAESQKQRVHETFLNGQLATREMEQTNIKHETFRASESAVDFDKRSPKSVDQHQQKESFPLIDDRDFSEQQGLPTNTLPRPLVDGENPVGIEDQIQLSPELIKMIEAIESMMERMTGKPYTMKVMGYTPEPPLDSEANHTEKVTKAPSSEAFNREFTTTVKGERLAVSESYSEQEYSNFKAQGSVTTADSQTIDFSLNASMHRSFQSQVHFEQTKGLVLKDPLVVNFGGSPASLTLDKISFDIDSDGQQDSVSFVESGSGFLVLDKNHDGIVNNGQELFGTQTGNGFEELAQYDQDQNGWIDESDAVFSQLQIWHQDENGLNQLQGLLELNIGAIYLQSEETQFSIKDANNNQLGQVVSTGLFVGEDHRVGSIQQIDLVV
ncbi:MAG: hypothetical protein U9R28_08360 [Pseudomonadota bacterium]|nr:hypothetical protein [Pseudomonadota bacterium]